MCKANDWNVRLKDDSIQVFHGRPVHWTAIVRRILTKIHVPRRKSAFLHLNPVSQVGMMSAMTKTCLLLGLLLGFSSLYGPAYARDEAGKVQIKLGREVVLDKEGIKFRSFKNCDLQPIPELDEHTLVRSDGLKLPVHSRTGLWRVAQFAGYLVAPEAVIYVAVPSLPILDSMSIPSLHQDFIERKTFDEWAGKTRGTEIPDLIGWISLFCGYEVTANPSQKIKASNPTLEIKAFLPSQDRRGRTWIYQVLDKKHPETCAFFIYEIQNVDDLKKVERIILSSIASVQFLPSRKKTVPGAAGASAKRLGNRTGASPASPSEKYNASRERVISSLRNLPNWWYRETPNYIMVSNLKKRSEINLIQEEAEKIRVVYETLFPAVKPVDEISVIRVFASRDEYLTYVGESMQWTSGVWMASKKELVFAPPDQLKGKARSEILIKVLYHELFHQYLFYVGGAVNSPIWFNEGFSQFFEDVDLKGGGKVTHSLEKDAFDKGSRAASGPYGDVKILKDISHQNFQAEPKLTYPAVWSMMYFMVKGAPCMKGRESFANIPGRYFRELLNSGNPVEANKKAWENVDLDQFNRAYHEFWQNKSLFAKSRNNGRLVPLLSPSDAGKQGNAIPNKK